jgi:glycosyltransferase involved in cell wall biosynthesis
MRHSAVNVDLVTGGYPDRWSLYDDADLLVLPRRYGGLCLPVLEAFASGVGVVMTDVEPQASTWPIIGVPTPAARRPVEMPCGPVPLSTVDPTVLARLLDEMVDDPEQIIAARYRARSFAVEHSWARLRSMYEHEFDSALKSRV